MGEEYEKRKLGTKKLRCFESLPVISILMTINIIINFYQQKTIINLG